ncbi:MAG: substrate-binding domain-containing protein [bacterium]
MKPIARLFLVTALLLGIGAAHAEERSILLATTTSVDATGLLDVVSDEFRKDTGIVLKWVAVGTGQALKQAQDGNADVVIVHAKKLENKFLEDGYGVNRRVIARNYFMLVGPENDPAGVGKAKNSKEAMQRIKDAGAAFASRGDKSGTHTRELELWALVGGAPDKNYMDVGQGMAQTLRVAMEKQAYTLTDTATYYGVSGISGLKPVFEDAPELENIYAVIALSPFKIPGAKYMDAMTFAAWLTSPRGQKVIGDFRKSNRVLFEPMADKPGVDLSK